MNRNLTLLFALVGLPTLSVLALAAVGCSSSSSSSATTPGSGASGTSAGGGPSIPGAGGSAPPSGGTSPGAGSGGTAAGGDTAGSGAQPNNGGGSGELSGGSAGASGSVGASGSAGAVAGAGTGAGGGAACPAGVLLCDDFESYPASSAPTGQWKTTTKGAGSATVDAMHAYSGTKAVHFQGSVNKDEAYIRASSAPVFPVKGNQIFVRFMMYVQTYPNANPMHVRFSWVGTSGVSSNTDGSGYTMCTYNGVAIERIASGYLRDTNQAMTQAANQNKWVCWEYEISNTDGPANGEGGTVLPRIWREGTALTLNMAGGKVNWNPASFDLVQFSLFAYQSDPTIAHYWFDDIAVSTSRIGCPAVNPAAK